MRTFRWAGLVCLLVLVVVGCRGAGPVADSTPSPTSAPSPAPTFLGTGGCAAREGVASSPAFLEVSCTSERAAARVLVRRAGAVAAGAGAAVDCPLTTDFVLYVSEGMPAARGYACMRNLEPPHPGDPGAGGGPFTVVGDCVYATGSDQVRETPCDGSGARAPQHRVASAVARRALCPPSTTLYVALAGPQPPVGCARRA